MSESEGLSTLANWMIAHGYATGHGDTAEDLLSELVAQVSGGDGMVRVPREPKPGLLCGDVAVSTDPRYAGFVFVRHVDGVNWTTCAKMTPETWTMLAAAQEGKS